MEIQRGVINHKGLKFVVYGPEGIGKSTFVSHIPGIVYIDTEGSTKQLDVARYPAPSSWEMLNQEVDDFMNRSDFSALVIDTADWADMMCISSILASRSLKSIEDSGYGKGYVYVAEEFGKLLNKLTLCSDRGKHVGFTAHAMMRKFEQPDELGSYDRWELKMSKKVAPMVKEWADLVLFANYKTLVYQADDKGKKHKAAGGQRVMYTSHHPCWDAKNRAGLPEELPFDFNQVAHLFSAVGSAAKPAAAVSQEEKKFAEVSSPEEAPPLVQVPAEESRVTVSVGDSVPKMDHISPEYDGIPQALLDLMEINHVTPLEIRAAVSQKGYFPLEAPIKNYPQDFIQGVLIGAWPQVQQMIMKNRENTPF